MSSKHKPEQELQDQNDAKNQESSSAAGSDNLEKDIMKDLNEEFENLTSDDELNFNANYDEEDDLFDDF